MPAGLSGRWRAESRGHKEMTVLGRVLEPGGVEKREACKRAPLGGALTTVESQQGSICLINGIGI